MAFPIPANRDSGSDTAGTVHAVSLTGIGTIAVGDGLLVAFTSDGAQIGSFPAGWTTIISHAGGGSGWPGVKVAYRKADGTEPTSFNVVTGSDEATVHRIWRFNGSDIADWAQFPPEGNVVAFTGVNNPDPPSRTASWGSGDNWWLAGYGSDSYQSATAYPSGTEAASQFTHSSMAPPTSGACAAGYAEEYTSALATFDPSPFTILNADNGSVYTIVVRPTTAVPIDQFSFRFRFDDGNEATATWQEAENVGISAGQSRRLRVLLDTSGDPAPITFGLQFKRVLDGESEWETLTT